MIAGIDFPSLFTKDNFTSRRTTGHNMHDPDSLLTGAEISAGFTYSNSAREWDSQRDYLTACLGLYTCEQIVEKGPRVFISKMPESINSMIMEDFRLGVM